MNDELWNLMPMDPSLNGAKSNHLPKWEPFFNLFAENQYLMYRLIHERSGIHKNLKPATGIICIRYGRRTNCIARETAGRDSAIS